MQRLHKLFFIVPFGFIIFALISLPVFADEDVQFKTTYDAHYTPRLNGDSLVNLSISITNLKQDIYVREFSLAFPKEFSMSNLIVKDDYGVITPQIDYKEKITQVSLTFSRPTIGKNAIGHLYLNYMQKNVFKTQGALWEVIIPTINNKQNTVFNVSITLPDNASRILSIAKPKPSYITGKTIFWKEVKTRTLYAVFGDRQHYTMNLTYTLKNDELRPVYYDIALPPPTEYQAITIHSLTPEPEKVYFDDDYNVLARYTLSVKEEKKIVLKAVATLFTHPQADMSAISKQRISRQKEYLLKRTGYWDTGGTGDTTAINNLNSAESIYRYVVSTLTYDYSRVNNNTGRMGASAILAQPKTAVCTEFTDLFIALARKKGILTREIEGYGFSQDQNLRPLSLVTDILHTWPEYYDEKKNQWIPIDPTWENTSGIDYFSSFDLNHIVFVIHGKDQSYPLPAGMYKISDATKDLEVSPTTIAPEEKVELQLSENVKREITDNMLYKGTVKIKNTGTTFLKNGLFELKSTGLIIEPKEVAFDILAPYQTKEISFTYRVRSVTQKTKTDLSFIFNTHPLRIIMLTITPFYTYIFYTLIGIVGGIIALLMVYIFFRLKYKRK